jgi:predicted metal-binding protein
MDKIFLLYKKTLDIFNSRCSCSPIKSKITIYKDYHTDEINISIANNWKARFECEEFGNNDFEGSLEEINNLLREYLKFLTFSIVNSCLENYTLWFKKEEPRQELLNIKNQLGDLNE